MSESEKFEAQGRAYAELKQTRSNVATIAASLQRWAEILERAGVDLKRLIGAPDQADGADLAQRIQVIDSRQIANLVRELETETQKASLLQQRVDRF